MPPDVPRRDAAPQLGEAAGEPLVLVQPPVVRRARAEVRQARRHGAGTGRSVTRLGGGGAMSYPQR